MAQFKRPNIRSTSFLASPAQTRSCLAGAIVTLGPTGFMILPIQVLISEGSGFFHPDASKKTKVLLSGQARAKTPTLLAPPFLIGRSQEGALPPQSPPESPSLQPMDSVHYCRCGLLRRVGCMLAFADPTPRFHHRWCGPYLMCQWLPLAPDTNHTIQVPMAPSTTVCRLLFCEKTPPTPCQGLFDGRAAFFN